MDFDDEKGTEVAIFCSGSSMDDKRGGEELDVKWRNDVSWKKCRRDDVIVCAMIWEFSDKNWISCSFGVSVWVLLALFCLLVAAM